MYDILLRLEVILLLIMLYTKSGNALQQNIPVNLQKSIIEQTENNSHFDKVYRVAKWGFGDPRTFISTYSEIQQNLIPDSDAKYPKDKIGTYSTSFYTSKSPCNKFIAFLKKRLKKFYPNPVILIGKTSDGLVQRTIERDSNHPEANHVDWWIYDGKEDYVTINFSLAEEEE